MFICNTMHLRNEGLILDTAPIFPPLCKSAHPLGHEEGFGANPCTRQFVYYFRAGNDFDHSSVPSVMSHDVL